MFQKYKDTAYDVSTADMFDSTYFIRKVEEQFFISHPTRSFCDSKVDRIFFSQLGVTFVEGRNCCGLKFEVFRNLEQEKTRYLNGNICLISS